MSEMIAAVTLVSMAIGAIVELVYRPARMGHVEALWLEIHALQERISVAEARLEERRP